MDYSSISEKFNEIIYVNVINNINLIYLCKMINNKTVTYNTNMY